MSSTTTTTITVTASVLRTLTLATVTPLTIYSLQSPKPDYQLEELHQQQPLPPADMSWPLASFTHATRDTLDTFLVFLNDSGIPWTILGGCVIVAGILGVQALGWSLKWVYGRCIKTEASAKENDE